MKMGVVGGTVGEMASLDGALAHWRDEAVRMFEVDGGMGLAERWGRLLRCARNEG